MINVVPKEIAEIKRELEIAASDIEEQKAVTDYNIMMGILEDPSEEEE